MFRAGDEIGAGAQSGGSRRCGLPEEVADVFAQRLIRRPVAGVVDVVFEIVEQFVRRGVALRQVPRQGPLQDAVQAVVHPVVQRAEIRDRHGENALAGFRGGGRFEQVASQQQMGQHDAGEKRSDRLSVT